MVGKTVIKRIVNTIGLFFQHSLTTITIGSINLISSFIYLWFSFKQKKAYKIPFKQKNFKRYNILMVLAALGASSLLVIGWKVPLLIYYFYHT